MSIVWTEANFDNIFIALEARIRKLETNKVVTPPPPPPAPTVFKIPLVTEDPTELVEGQAWVNSSINTFNVFYNGVNHRVSLGLG